MSLTIRKLHAREILDSRGNPTLSVAAELSDGTVGEAKVPSGASTGRHEAVELRDGDPARYAGKGVRRAAENVNGELDRAMKGADAEQQAALDCRMIELDGTGNKSRLGANAMLGVSCAVARSVSNARRLELWDYLRGERRAVLPLPMVNILSGGLHAGRNFEFQDFLAVPNGIAPYSEGLEAIVAVHRQTQIIIQERGYLLTGVADEGGWGPWLETNELALEILTSAIERAGFRPGEQMSIAIDVASSHFYRDGVYDLKTEKRQFSAEQMAELLDGWVRRYAIVSIEDGLAEDDWDGWRLLTERLGGRIRLIGDDFFTTNPERVARGMRENAGNAVLVKMNQIGTLTETFEVIDMCAQAGYAAVISARSGETEDSFLADLAAASGAGQIKIGSITRSERLSKYNRLLEMEESGKLPYAVSPC